MRRMRNIVKEAEAASAIEVRRRV